MSEHLSKTHRRFATFQSSSLQNPCKLSISGVKIPSISKTMERYLRTAPRRTVAPPIYLHHHQLDEVELFILKPATWFVQLIAFQLELISNWFSSFSSMVSETLNRAEKAREATEEAVHSVSRAPSRVAHGGTTLLRKLGLGFVGAVYVSMVLAMVMVVSVLIGVVLVRSWVEEPVFLKEALLFDYTDPNPSALVYFGGFQGKKMRFVPAGHTVFVSVVLLMPESDYNRQIGMFQLTAEAISSTGDILAKSGQPCMLRFKSLPVRLMQTFVMSVPLLLGISCETQEICVRILKFKEGKPKTEAIRVRLKPRAGTSSVPELYSAEILMNSQLPWRKQVVYNWKWTFYVWTSLYVYIILLIIMLCCFKSFPLTGLGGRNHRVLSILNDRHSSVGVKDMHSRVRRNGETSDGFSDTLSQWQRSRSKRKAFVLHEVSTSGTAGYSGSNVTIEDVGESKSICGRW